MYRELQYEAYRGSWTREMLAELTEGGSVGLLVRGAFDPNRVTSELLSPVDMTLRYTQTPHSFKRGDSYEESGIYDYLERIEALEEFYCSWGTSSMNDSAEAIGAFQAGADAFLRACAPEWHEALVVDPASIVGHFIAGNTLRETIKTPNHFAWTINNVFQLRGEKIWYLMDIAEIQDDPRLMQFSPMEFTLDIEREAYQNDPRVHKVHVGAGDYFFNPVMMGHAVAMGPGPNVMLSVRLPTKNVHLRPALVPLVLRQLHVVRAIIHSDVSVFHRWRGWMEKADRMLYGADIHSDVSVSHRWRGWMEKADRMMYGADDASDDEDTEEVAREAVSEEVVSEE